MSAAINTRWGGRKKGRVDTSRHQGSQRRKLSGYGESTEHRTGGRISKGKLSRCQCEFGLTGRSGVVFRLGRPRRSGDGQAPDAGVDSGMRASASASASASAAHRDVGERAQEEVHDWGAVVARHASEDWPPADWPRGRPRLAWCHVTEPGGVSRRPSSAPAEDDQHDEDYGPQQHRQDHHQADHEPVLAHP
jgi:hypothetical protein